MTSIGKGYVLLLFISAASVLRALLALTVPAWPQWGSCHLLSPTGVCPQPRTLYQPPGATSPCRGAATAGTFSSSPQPCPSTISAKLSPTAAIPIPSQVPWCPGLGLPMVLPAPDCGGPTGPGCQALTTVFPSTLFPGEPLVLTAPWHGGRIEGGGRGCRWAQMLWKSYALLLAVFPDLFFPWPLHSSHSPPFFTWKGFHEEITTKIQAPAEKEKSSRKQ